MAETSSGSEASSHANRIVSSTITTKNVLDNLFVSFSWTSNSNFILAGQPALSLTFCYIIPVFTANFDISDVSCRSETVWAPAGYLCIIYIRICIYVCVWLSPHLEYLVWPQAPRGTWCSDHGTTSHRSRWHKTCSNAELTNKNKKKRKC